MKTVSTFLFVGMLLFGTSTFAAKSYDSGVPFPKELQELLEDAELNIEKEVTVRVIFRLNDNHEVEIYSVVSEDEEIREYVKKRLEKQQLTGEKWHTRKLYELPVRLQPRK